MCWDDSGFKPAKRVLHGGSSCPLCGRGVLCLNGLASHGAQKILVCSDCREGFCAHCGQTSFRTNEIRMGVALHICTSCLGYLDVFLAGLPDGEWVRLSHSEVFTNGRPKRESEVIQLAFEKAKAHSA